MKKNFNYYGICWLIALVVFNVIAFVTPSEIAGISKYTGAFWFGYIFITLAFIGQLGCTYKAFKTENLKKLFYNIPLISISYTGLVVMLIVGIICMAVPFIPYWVGIIACMLVLAFSAITIIKATVAADVVSETDEQIKKHTQFIKLLTADSEHLMSSSMTAELKAETKKVYETIKYSDPMSCEELSDIEEQIQSEFSLFKHAIKSEDLELAKSISVELLNSIDDRNKKCKALK